MYVLEFIKYDKQRTFLSRIDRNKFLKRCFHKTSHFRFVLAYIIQNFVYEKLSIQMLFNPKLILNYIAMINYRQQLISYVVNLFNLKLLSYYC